MTLFKESFLLVAVKVTNTTADMIDGIMELCKKTRKPGDDVQRIASDEQSGGYGYTPGRHGDFLSIVLQLLDFEL